MPFSFYKFGGREHLVGPAEEGGFEPPTLLVAGGVRPGRGADTFCLCLAPSVTNQTGKAPSVSSNTTSWAKTLAPKRLPSLGQGCT